MSVALGAGRAGASALSGSGPEESGAGGHQNTAQHAGRRRRRGGVLARLISELAGVSGMLLLTQHVSFAVAVMTAAAEA